jgi:hypothetical protein
LLKVFFCSKNDLFFSIFFVEFLLGVEYSWTRKLKHLAATMVADLTARSEREGGREREREGERGSKKRERGGERGREKSEGERVREKE